MGIQVFDHVQFELPSCRQTCQSRLKQCAQSREVRWDRKLGAAHDFECRQACWNAACPKQGEQHSLIEHDVTFDLEVPEILQALNLDGERVIWFVVALLRDLYCRDELLRYRRRKAREISLEAVGLKLTQVWEDATCE
jgi:hypothetical protein